MNLNDIVTLPNPILRQKSSTVKRFDNQLFQLFKDMSVATLDWEDKRNHELGVALAAIQIGVPKRLIIIRNNFDDKSDREFVALVNPKIIKLSGKQVKDFEGCLSVPDLYGLVPRYETVKVKAKDLKGKELRLKASGFLARVLQHEIDHTHGILFIDHLKDDRKSFYRLNDNGKLEQISYDQLDTDSFLWQ